MPIITLTTDFGLSDHYVGVMKGVILGINPESEIVDISHLVSPQDIREGAFTIAAAAPYFPFGTIHVGVVDPGVGSERRKLLIETESGFFIGPDNGIFSLALAKTSVKRTIKITNNKFFLPDISKTFHGRDVFAPVAAHLSLGTDAKEFGDPGSPPLPLSEGEAIIASRKISGEIIHIDRFGNIITNIKWTDILRLGKTEGLTAVLKDVHVTISSGSYSSVAKGTLTAILCSSGLLEIAERDGSAVEKLAVTPGERVVVCPIKNETGGERG